MTEGAWTEGTVHARQEDPVIPRWRPRVELKLRKWIPQQAGTKASVNVNCQENITETQSSHLYPPKNVFKLGRWLQEWSPCYANMRVRGQISTAHIKISVALCTC